MKALILAAGQGKRLKISYNKCTIFFNEKPLIEYSLDYASKLNVTEIVIVIGELGEDVIEMVGHSYKGIKINYVYQDIPNGIVDAISCAKDVIGNNDFMLMFGDEMLFNNNVDKMLEKFKRNIACVCGVVIDHDKKSIAKTYTIGLNNKGTISKLVEKPKKALSKYKGTGYCLMKKNIFKYITKDTINLVDLLQNVIDKKKTVVPCVVCQEYYNVNTLEDLTLLSGGSI